MSVTSSSDLPTDKKKLRDEKGKEEPDWKDIKIEDLDNDDDDDDEEEEIVSVAAKPVKEQPDLPESAVDLQGGTIVYIDSKKWVRVG